MAKRLVVALLCVTLLLGTSVALNVSNLFYTKVDAGSREIKVPVTMYKAYDNSVSMANASLVHTANIIEEGGKSYVTIDFRGMNLMGLHGNITRVFAYPPKMTAQATKTSSAYVEAEVNEVGKDLDIDQQTVEFPRKVTFVRNAVGEKEFFIRVWVNAMDSLQGGKPGSAAANARLVFDYSKAVVVSSDSGSGRADTQVDANETATQQETQATDSEEAEVSEAVPEKATGQGLPEKLEDGKYTFVFDLWNSNEEKQSMGHKSFNKTGLLEVKDNNITIFLSVHPMSVGDIIASVETIEYKDKDGNWANAEVIANNLEGKKPSAFSFPLLSRGEFLDVKVNPKVAVMGAKPLPARLKFNWSSLKKDDNAKLDDNIKTSYSTKSTPAAVLLDEATGIKIVTPERTVPRGSKIKVTPINEGELFSKIKTQYKTSKLDIYDIQIVNSAGDIIEPLNAVDIYFPISDKWNASTTALSFYSKEGAKTALSTELEGQKIKLHTNRLGIFGINDQSNIVLSIPIIVGIAVASSLVIIAVILIIIKNRKLRGNKSIEKKNK